MSRGIGKEEIRERIKTYLLKKELPVLGVNKNTIKQAGRVDI